MLSIIFPLDNMRNKGQQGKQDAKSVVWQLKTKKFIHQLLSHFGLKKDVFFSFFFVFFPKNGKWKKKSEKGERKGNWTCPFLIFPGVYKSEIPNPQALVVVAVMKIFYYKYNLDILYSLLYSVLEFSISLYLIEKDLFFFLIPFSLF